MALLRKKLCTFYRRTVRIFFALIAAWLFVSCLVTSTVIAPGPLAPEISWVCPDNAWLQSLLFIAACLIFCVLIRKGDLPSMQMDVLRYVLIGLGGFLAVFWVLCARPAPYMDAFYVQKAATDLHEGTTYLFEPGEYLAIYPHQSGLVLLHYILQIFDPDSTLLFQLFNALCYIGILYILGEFAQEFGFGPSGKAAATCLGAAFLPLALYVPFVYGTVSGLFFSMASILMTIRFFHNSGWMWGILASLFLSLGIMLKSNYQIFGLGLLLCTVYLALCGQKGAWKLTAILLVGFVLGGKLPILLLERITNCSLHDGMASLAWVAMGLRSDSVRGPGWFSEYALETYFASNMDPKSQAPLVLDCISGIFQGWLMDPKAMVSFFFRKNASQWSAPLFQSVLLNARMRDAATTAAPQWVNSFLRDPEPPVLTWLLNLLQTLIYGGLVLWAWVPTHEKRKPQEDLLAVILVGGFVFHTFWVAKSQYTLPYVVLILPLALLGYKRLALLAKDGDAKSLWRSPMGKLRFLMPVLLMVLALALSAVLSTPLSENWNALLEAIGTI